MAALHEEELKVGFRNIFSITSTGLLPQVRVHSQLKYCK